MEEQGTVNRELLYNFSGRSRKPQMALAEEYGLTDYPAPAGGCLLTEPNYSFRLRELLDHDPDPSLEDLALLRVGRHFRISGCCKIIVGRNRNENESLLAIDNWKSIHLRAENYASPSVLLRGKASGDSVLIAASLCARYSDGKDQQEVKIKITDGSRIEWLNVAPADEDLIARYKIEWLKKDKTGKIRKTLSFN
jgi:tRNA-uridine 2-sulfurtransferase